MKERTVLQYQQRSYIPAIAIIRATLKYSWNKLPVATTATPDQICGEARRIGYTGKDDDDLALYRLKIKSHCGLPTVTLPGLYIIEDGLFLDYDDWKKRQEKKKENM
jgi:hypothetical protein